MTRSSASRRLALLGLAVVAVAAGHVAGPGTTAARFTSAAQAGSVVSVVPACTGDPAGYTAGRLDSGGPLLRWTFSATGSVGPAAVQPVTPAGETGDAGAGDTGTAPTGTAPTGTAPTGTGIDVPPPATPAAEEPAADAADDTAGPVTPAPAAPTGDPAGTDPAPGATGDADATGATTPDPAGDPTGVAGDGATGGTAGPVAPAPAPAVPLPSPHGLLVCDPADLAAGGAADPSADRSLDLVGGTGGGVVSAGPATGTGPFALALWVRAEPGAADGEVASLTAAPRDGTDGDPADDPDVLGLTVTGDRLWVTRTAGGTTTILADAPLARAATHLVALSVHPAPDGGAAVTVAVDDGADLGPVPVTEPYAGATLTVGARPGVAAAAARVDEVTVLPALLAPADRSALLAADRWWTSPAG